MGPWDFGEEGVSGGGISITFPVRFEDSQIALRKPCAGDKWRFLAVQWWSVRFGIETGPVSYYDAGKIGDGLMNPFSPTNLPITLVVALIAWAWLSLFSSLIGNLLF